MDAKILVIASALLLASCGSSSSSSTAASSLSSSITSEMDSSISRQTSEQNTSDEITVVSDSISSQQEEDQADPMDEPYIGEQYYLNHIGDIYSTWNHYRGDGITIAVIDEGFNPYHEDFYYSDGTSKVSPLSASFVTESSTNVYVGVEQVVNMGQSHGTFCAGVAAAAVNGKGVAGIAPNATLMLLKTDRKPKSIAKAFHYAADNGAKVISISIGSYNGTYEGDLVDDGSNLLTVFNEPVSYCRAKGSVVISAAGNGGPSNPTEYTYPGAVSGVIGVGGLAANSSGEIWSGSSYNYNKQHEFCDVFAPSEDMFGCCHYDDKLYDGGWKGTSFAAPQVAGMAALYFQKNPNKSPTDFENDLYNSCSPLKYSSIASESQLGHGRVDVGKLLGTNAMGDVEVRFKANWSSVYCYAWNEATESEIAPWPGRKLSAVNGIYSLSVDVSTYHSLLFAKNDNGPKTVDLMISSFISGKTYEVTNEKSLNVGSYRSL